MKNGPKNLLTSTKEIKLGEYEQSHLFCEYLVGKNIITNMTKYEALEVQKKDLRPICQILRDDFNVFKNSAEFNLCLEEFESLKTKIEELYSEMKNI